MISMERLYNQLNWEQVDGTRQELKVLRAWIDELEKNKGQDWIRRHRLMLRDQWRYFLKHGVEKLAKPP
jgi:hypothetical protein